LKVSTGNTRVDRCFQTQVQDVYAQSKNALLQGIPRFSIFIVYSFIVACFIAETVVALVFNAKCSHTTRLRNKGAVMTEGSIVIDCWGELFYITPGLGLELGFDGPQGFPLPFHNELSVAMFLGSLSSFDLSLLSQRFSPKALHGHKDLQRAIIRGRLLVFPMDTPISLMSAVQNGGRSNQAVSGTSNLGALNTKKLSGYSSANNDLMCVNRTQKVIRSEIRTVLRQIVEQERIESRKIEKAYKNKSTLGKAGAHINHFRKGLHEATGSFLTWLKEVNDVVSINQRLFRILIASNIANHANSDERYEVYQKVLTALEKKEIVEALGFDPSLITAEKVTEVYSLAKLIHDDHATQLIIKHFIRYYIDAQHQLEWSETAGGATFEIILTAFMAVVTGGVGAIASLGAQARKLSQMKKLGELFIELAELLKKVPKAKVLTMRKQKEKEDKAQRKKEARQPDVEPVQSNKPDIKSKSITSFDEAESRLNDARKEIEQRKAAGKPLYKPKYTEAQLLTMAKNGATANERFLVSVQPKNSAPDATLAYQRESGLVPAWTTSFDQLEAADSDPKIIHQVLGIESNFDPKKEYVMHIVDRGENLDQFGNNTIVPTWDNLSDASVRELSAYDGDTVRSTMNSEYQAKYAADMQKFWDAGGNDFKPNNIEKYSKGMSPSDKKLFLARHKVRTEIGANAEFTGNGLTANTAPGGGSSGVVETLSLERDLPELSVLQDKKIVRTIDLTPI